MHPADFGNSSYMISVPAERAAPAIESLDRLFADLRYRGIFSAEFKFDEHEGEFKLLEVNARAWWYIGFATQCGVNVAEMAYRDALGLEVEALAGYRVGVACMHFMGDLALVCRGRLGFWKWLRAFLTAKQSAFSWTDPLPSLVNFASLARRRLTAYGPKTGSTTNR